MPSAVTINEVMRSSSGAYPLFGTAQPEAEHRFAAVVVGALCFKLPSPRSFSFFFLYAFDIYVTHHDHDDDDDDDDDDAVADHARDKSCTCAHCLCTTLPPAPFCPPLLPPSPFSAGPASLGAGGVQVRDRLSAA
eukprot:435734-Rhodomonas_salina.1